MDSNLDSDHPSHVDCDPDSNPDSGPSAHVNAAIVVFNYREVVFDIYCTDTFGTSRSRLSVSTVLTSLLTVCTAYMSLHILP